jgi:hypothetical protein
MIIRGASWCDFVKHADGRVELVSLIGSTVSCAQRWSVDTKHSLLYFRAAADGAGRVLAAGQGEDEAGTVRTVIDGTIGPDLGGTPFPFSVLVHGDENGWTVFIQRTSTSYDEVWLGRDGNRLGQLTHSMPPTSQGFLYVDEDGTPITQDRGRGAIPGLALPSPAPGGDVWVGQSMTAATIALFDSDTGQITPLGTPGGQPPHIVESGGTYYVCSYVDGGAWLSTHRRPFAAVTPPPVEPPPVDPGEPDMSVQDVPNYADELEAIADANPVAFRNAHGDYDHQGQPGFLTEEQANEFIRIAAYELNKIDGGIGLNGKRATSTLSQDALCYRHADGKESVIDVINGAGGSNPSIGWSVVGHYRTAGDGQRWIQPQRVSGSTPTPGPTPTPTPTPPPAGRAFPAFLIPDDVFKVSYRKYIGTPSRPGVYARDRFVENPPSDEFPEGTFIGSTGTLMWYVPIFVRNVVAHIAAHGNNLPTPDEWWALGDKSAVDAIAFYRRTAPPE